MTLTVRLPHRVEQQLAEYCVKRKLTKSEAVKQALDSLLREPVQSTRHPFIGGDQGDGADVSGNIKAALRARFNPPSGAAIPRKRAR
jgi:hypothetical protein